MGRPLGLIGGSGRWLLCRGLTKAALSPIGYPTHGGEIWKVQPWGWRHIVEVVNGPRDSAGRSFAGRPTL
jgi:hypothetical protein